VYPQPRHNAVNPSEKTTQLAWKSSTGPATQAEPQDPKSSFAGGGVTRLELERQLSELLAAQIERDQLIARQTDELALKSALLEQAEANAADRLLMQTSPRDVELVGMQAKLRNTEAKLNELVVSRDRQKGLYKKELGYVRVKLEAKESELEAVRLQLADAEKGRTLLDELVVSRDQQVEQYEKELGNVRVKLEAKESELEAVRLRLTDAERGLIKSKAEADTLRRAQNATGSVNRDEDQVTRRLMERVRAIEAEMASKRRNEKSIEEMECSNEKSIEEMEYRNEG
jgi:hypothetical protein